MSPEGIFRCRRIACVRCWAWPTAAGISCFSRGMTAGQCSCMPGNARAGSRDSMRDTRAERGTFLTIALPLYAWAAAMLAVSSVPGSRLPAVSLWQWDKLAHVFEYAVLALLLVRFVTIRWEAPPGRVWLIVLPIGTGYGALDELHQMLIPGRMCTWQDLVADSAGVVLGIAVMFLIRRWRGR
ncbi:MAG: hypothetical protein GF418_02435 [Chitinivibrionales bacterium]|nr:hypothetical protein [Chitinivibrionales bacterium]MBD3394459.1 hypothetical protein [Chitinivibrionales bacterium]